ncbi:Zinc finger BED domain-containing protein RICESLEEPER 2 [Bienertia sinuspersici]
MDSEPSSRMSEDGYSEYSRPKSKRKKTSKVWHELVEGRNEKGETIATCIHCKLALVAGPNRGTSHLKRHLIESCPLRPVGLPLGEGGTSSREEEEFVFNMTDLRKEILLYIVEGAHPFSTVEEKAFRRMMSKATPLFKPFSRATITRDLFSMYYCDRERVKSMLLNAPGRICFTTDNWRSSHTWQHYICITAHFVDCDWKLHKLILRFRGLSPPYDGQSISEEIFMFLNQWKIEHKVLSVTVDNATYNDTMISHLKTRLLLRGLLFGDGSFFHVRCCAHIINLIVQSGLDVIASILDNIRNLVKIITRSSSKSKEFYDTAQKNFHLEVKRKLNLDMKARWNSTFDMLDNILYYKDVFVHLGSVSANFKSYVPSESEWDKLIGFHKFLKLFYDVTCMFSAVNSPTSNLYFKGAWMVHRCLLETAQGPHSFLSSMVEPMLENFDKYWSEYNVILSCAAILDPRFKVKFVEYCLVKLFGVDDAMIQVGEVLTTLKTLSNEYKLQSSTSPIVAPCPPSSGLDHFFMITIATIQEVLGHKLENHYNSPDSEPRLSLRLTCNTLTNQN